MADEIVDGRVIKRSVSTVKIRNRHALYLYFSEMPQKNGIVKWVVGLAQLSNNLRG